MSRDAAHERSLVRYLRYQVRPYSARYRHLLQLHAVTSANDLARLPLTSLAEWGDPGQLVLRPTKDTIFGAGDLSLRLQLLWATLWRRERSLARRVVDPIYKPVHWIWDGGVAIGYSAEDVERLGEAGRLRLQSAGVTTADVLVGIVKTTAPLAFWQLALGARRGGVPALLLPDRPDPLELARLAPTVLAGTVAELRSVLDRCREEAVALGDLRTLIVTGQRLDPLSRSVLAASAAPANPAVVSWWAPPGVRALWGECRSGPTFHLIPAVDHVELVDEAGATVADGDAGEIVWTPVGWKGTVVLRLRTGTRARVAAGPCRSCGTSVPRLEVEDAPPRSVRRRHRLTTGRRQRRG